MTPTPELLALRDLCARLEGVSIEDLILSKLEWSRESRSEQQRRDISLLVEAPLDRAYLDEWAASLELDGLLKEIERG